MPLGGEDAMKLRRRGHTLVECSVALALIGTALGLVTATIQVLHQADCRLRDEFSRDGAVERLTTQLRCDAHQALSAKADNSTDKTASVDSLLLSLPDDRSIQYTLLHGSEFVACFVPLDLNQVFGKNG
jgi:prepilin-type N-terminal cleavage/methylation domain-containing protein